MRPQTKISIFAVIATFLGSAGVFPVHADEVVKKFPAGGAADLLENPKNPVSDTGGAMKILRECKTSDGKTVFKGDPAYDACLKEKLEKPKK